MRNSNDQKRGRRGFTLAETVIALAIMVIAVPALIGAIAFATKTAADMARRDSAMVIADGVLTDLKSSHHLGVDVVGHYGLDVLPAGPGEGGSSAEMFFDRFGGLSSEDEAFWRCEVEVVPDDDLPGLYHLRTSVLWPARVAAGTEPGKVSAVARIQF